MSRVDERKARTRESVRKVIGEKAVRTFEGIASSLTDEQKASAREGLKVLGEEIVQEFESMVSDVDREKTEHADTNRMLTNARATVTAQRKILDVAYGLLKQWPVAGVATHALDMRVVRFCKDNGI